MLDEDGGTVVPPVGLTLCVVLCDTVGAASCRSARLGGGRRLNGLLGGEEGSCSATFPTGSTSASALVCWCQLTGS